MIKFIKSETLGNYDSYFFEEETVLSKRNIMITVDFGAKEIRGDEVSYGKYIDLSFDECVRFLGKLESKEVKRNFNNFL